MKTPQDVIIRPLLTEKTERLREREQKYTFRVRSGSNKVEIRQAIEDIYKVRVAKVNTISVKGKARRTGRITGRTPDWKKAVVTLVPGQKIELFEGRESS